VFEKNILQKILVTEYEEMTGNLKHLHKDDQHILNIVQYKLGDHVTENEKAGLAVGVSEINLM
jgi:hypothetical protein